MPYDLAVLFALFIVLIVLFVVFPIAGMALGAILSTIVVGLIIGALGRLVVPGRQPISLIATILAGLIGAIIGGFLGDHVFSVGWLGTTLLEIGVAAGVVALMTSREFRHRTHLR